MWSSVLFYKAPDTEVTACVLLSTKAIYFLLDDSVIHSNEHYLGKSVEVVVWLLIKFVGRVGKVI